MAVVLATDTYETIQPVVRRLAEQTVKERLEIVIVARLPPDSLGAHRRGLGGFAKVRLVAVAPTASPAAARAPGSREGAAPLRFIGETPPYPPPEGAAPPLKAFQGPGARG